MRIRTVGPYRGALEDLDDHPIAEAMKENVRVPAVFKNAEICNGRLPLFICVQMDCAAADCAHTLHEKRRREPPSSNFVREILRGVLKANRSKSAC
jgi:hypothetical protein